MTQVITREHAVSSIAAVLADRTHVVIGVPPTMVTTAAGRLDGMPSAWFVDNGTGLILATELCNVAAAASLLLPVTVVVLVPKTVPAADIQRAIGEHYPADGSKDVVHLGDAGEDLTVLPGLLVDAITAVDPAFGAALYASSITNLS